MLAASQGCRAESLLYKQSWDGTEKPLLYFNTEHVSCSWPLSITRHLHRSNCHLLDFSSHFTLSTPSSVWIIHPFPSWLSSLTANAFFIKLLVWPKAWQAISFGSSEMRDVNSLGTGKVLPRYTDHWNVGLSAQNICDICHHPELYHKALELIIYVRLSFVLWVLRDKIGNEWKKNFFTMAFCTSIFVLQFFIQKHHRGMEFSFLKQLLHLK